MRSAKEIWDSVKVRYARTNIPKLFSLTKELSHMSQDNLSILAYFTKYKTLQDELACLTATPRCNCGKCTCTVNTHLDNYEQSLQLTRFLMSLNEQFTSDRGQILLIITFLLLAIVIPSCCKMRTIEALLVILKLLLIVPH